MLLPINWLKDFVSLDKSANEIGDVFHNIGFTLDGIDDDILDLEITPNRGDAVSVYGLAREISAKAGQEVKPYNKPAIITSKSSSIIEFGSDQAKSAAPRFAYAIIKGISIGPSPKEIQERLKSIGISPKNNIVDLTNYLMHEYGQPLHAFDLKKIDKLKLDFASSGQTAGLLNDINIDLTDKNLVAYSNNEIVDLVGISGCANSSINEQTTDILLQAAIFDPAVVRASSKAVNVQTPASYRYERGVDIESPLPAIARAIEHLTKWGGKVGEIVDIINTPISKHTIDFDFDLTKKISGIEVSRETAETILHNLGFTIDGNTVSVPTWRAHDVVRPIDITEEILRIYGYEHIRPQPLSKIDAPSQDDVIWQSIRAQLQDVGFTEAESTSFIGKKEALALNYNLEDLVEITNPLSVLNRYMRPSLQAKLVQAASNNPWYDQFTIFEIGHVFKKGSEAVRIAALAISKNNKLQDIFDEDKIIKVSPDSAISQLQKMKKSFYYAEDDIDNIKIKPTNLKIELSSSRFEQISKFPPSIRDVAFLVDRQENIFDIAEAIKKVDGSILLVEPFDEYESDKFDGQKSIALRITYQNLDHTLASDEVDKLHGKVTQFIKDNYGATIR